MEIYFNYQNQRGSRLIMHNLFNLIFFKFKKELTDLFAYNNFSQKYNNFFLFTSLKFVTK